jgi:hypothetical protein
MSNTMTRNGNDDDIINENRRTLHPILESGQTVEVGTAPRSQTFCESANICDYQNESSEKETKGTKSRTIHAPDGLAKREVAIAELVLIRDS